MQSAHATPSSAQPHPGTPPWAGRIDALAGRADAPAGVGLGPRPDPCALMRSVLDALGLGVLLVDADGQVLLANRCARSICKPGAALGLADQRLCLPAADQQRLDRALRAAQRGLRSMLLLRQGQQCLAVGVVPMSDDAANPSLVAMLVMGPPEPMRSLALQFFSQAHQLTPTESGVLAALSQGQRPGAIAAASDVAVCTVRTQITAIRSKTQSSSISHLLQQLSGLPPLAPQCLANA